MSLKFYYAPQSNASRILGTLLELGIPYETVKLDIRAGDTRKPEFLAVNPNGKVPTIVLDGTPMWESVAIQIALGERFGVEKGVWPKVGSPEHMQALTWIVWSQVTMAGALFRYFQNTSEFFEADTRNAKQAESALKDMHTCLRILDERLNGRQYLITDRHTIVDLDIVSTLGWAVGWLKIDISGYKNLGAWMQRVGELPSMKKAEADQ